jgi:hypothetical protein
METTRHKLTRDIGFYQSLCAKMQQLKVGYSLQCAIRAALWEGHRQGCNQHRQKCFTTTGRAEWIWSFQMERVTRRSWFASTRRDRCMYHAEIPEAAYMERIGPRKL